MLSSEHFRCTFRRLSIRMMSLTLTVWGLTPLVLVVVSVDLFTVHCSNFRLYIVTLLRLVYGFISSMSSPLTCFSLCSLINLWKQLSKAMSWLYVLPYEDSEYFLWFYQKFSKISDFFLISKFSDFLFSYSSYLIHMMRAFDFNILASFVPSSKHDLCLKLCHLPVQCLNFFLYKFSCCLLYVLEYVLILSSSWAKHQMTVNKWAGLFP